MAVHYTLFENRLTSEPGDYWAKVNPVGTVNMEAMIKKMIESGSTVTKADILSVMTDFESALFSFLEDGMNVTLPFANFSMSIKGRFEGQTDRFDPIRHQMRCNLNPGTALHDLMRSGIPVIKEDAVKPVPVLGEYTDYNSGEKNSLCTPGGMGQVVGNRLKIDTGSGSEGLFFVSGDGTETKVDVIGRNTETILMFLIPATLTAGDYKLKVKTQFGSELRTGELDGVLNVA